MIWTVDSLASLALIVWDRVLVRDRSRVSRQIESRTKTQWHHVSCELRLTRTPSLSIEALCLHIHEHRAYDAPHQRAYSTPSKLSLLCAPWIPSTAPLTKDILARPPCCLLIEAILTFTFGASFGIIRTQKYCVLDILRQMCIFWIQWKTSSIGSRKLVQGSSLASFGEC